MKAKESIWPVAKWGLIVFFISLPFLFLIGLRMKATFIASQVFESYLEILKKDKAFNLLIKMEADALLPVISLDSKNKIEVSTFEITCEKCGGILGWIHLSHKDIRLSNTGHEKGCPCPVCKEWADGKVQNKMRPHLEQIEKVLASRTSQEGFSIQNLQEKVTEGLKDLRAYHEWLEYIEAIPLIGNSLYDFITRPSRDKERFMKKAIDKMFK